MIRMIAAVSSNGVIGVDGTLPFYYPEDLKHFKQCTLNCTVIMGRKTYQSIGKPLPNRRNIVLTSQFIDNVETAKSLEEALNRCSQDNVWIIGGESVYREGMKYADEIYLTQIPDIIEGTNLVMFPVIDPNKFKLKEEKKIVNLDLHIYSKLNSANFSPS